MNKSIDVSEGSTLKKKLANLYESQSGNGGDPTYSARGGSSKRSKKTSITHPSFFQIQILNTF